MESDCANIYRRKITKKRKVQNMDDYRTVSIDELEEGMVLAKSIYVKGVVLLQKGIELNEKLIKSIKNILMIGDVDIYLEESQYVDETNPIIMKKFYKYIEIDKLLDEMAKHLKSILNKNNFGIDQLKNKINEMLENSTSPLRNIIIRGSEKDSIYRHSINVAVLGGILGKWIGFDKKDIDNIICDGILCNIGKTTIDKRIINKKGKLTQKEYGEIKNYPVRGYNILRYNTRLEKPILNAILMHHEREDGSGYPLGIKGDLIDPIAKIIAIADVFDAINSKRYYRKSKCPFEVLDIMKDEANECRLDQEYCRVFIEHMSDYYLGEYVLLNNNKKCKIVQIDKNIIDKPLVYIEEENDFIDLTKHRGLYVDKVTF